MLKQVLRQNEGELIEILNDIREGRITEKGHNYIRALNNTAETNETVNICSHSLDCIIRNTAKLNELPGQAYNGAEGVAFESRGTGYTLENTE